MKYLNVLLCLCLCALTADARPRQTPKPIQAPPVVIDDTMPEAPAVSPADCPGGCQCTTTEVCTCINCPHVGTSGRIIAVNGVTYSAAPPTNTVYVTRQSFAPPSYGTCVNGVCSPGVTMYSGGTCSDGSCSMPTGGLQSQEMMYSPEATMYSAPRRGFFGGGGRLFGGRIFGRGGRGGGGGCSSGGCGG